MVSSDGIGVHKPDPGTSMRCFHAFSRAGLRHTTYSTWNGTGPSGKRMTFLKLTSTPKSTISITGRTGRLRRLRNCEWNTPIDQYNPASEPPLFYIDQPTLISERSLALLYSIPPIQSPRTVWLLYAYVFLDVFNTGTDGTDSPNLDIHSPPALSRHTTNAMTEAGHPVDTYVFVDVSNTGRGRTSRGHLRSTSFRRKSAV